MIVKYASKINKSNSKFTFKNYLIHTSYFKEFTTLTSEDYLDFESDSILNSYFFRASMFELSMMEQRRRIDQIKFLTYEKRKFECHSSEYWSNIQEVFEKSSKLCDDRLFWELDNYILPVKNRIILLEFLYELKRDLFVLFLFNLTSKHSFLGKGTEFSDFQRFLTNQEQKYSKDEVEWLKLLNIARQMDWLMASNLLKDTFTQQECSKDLFIQQECSEDLFYNFERWCNLFSKLDKIEKEFKQIFYRTLVLNHKEDKTMIHEKVTFILRLLQSQENICLLENELAKYVIVDRYAPFRIEEEIHSIQKYATFKINEEIGDLKFPFDNWNRYNLLCMYVYFLQKESVLLGKMLDSLDKVLDTNSSNYLSELIDTFNDYEGSKRTELTNFERYARIEFNDNLKDDNFIDFASSSLKDFLENSKIHLHEEVTTTVSDWNKLMQSVQTSCQARYLFDLFNLGIISWDTWNKYSPETFQSSGIKPNMLGLNSWNEFNLHRRDFLVSGSQWSKDGIYKAIESFQSIDKLDPKIISNPAIIDLRKRLPVLGEPKQVLWWRRFQDCFLKDCNERLGFPIDDHTITYGPEQARIDYLEEWGIQHGPLEANSSLYDPIIVKKK